MPLSANEQVVNELLARKSDAKRQIGIIIKQKEKEKSSIDANYATQLKNLYSMVTAIDNKLEGIDDL